MQELRAIEVKKIINSYKNEIPNKGDSEIS